MLLASPGRSLQVQEVVAEPDSWLGDWFDHEGEEFLLILEGALLLQLQGAGDTELGAGDAVWYRSATPHRWRADSAERVRVLAVSSVAGRPVEPPHSA